MKWLTYQLTKWVRLHMSQAACLRVKETREACVWLSTPPCDWNAYQTDFVHPFPQSASTHGHSTPIIRGSQPIRTFVHCYSNHGAYWGAHQVAMETASVYNSVKKMSESCIDSYWEMTTRGFYLFQTDWSVLFSYCQSLWMLTYLQVICFFYGFFQWAVKARLHCLKAWVMIAQQVAVTLKIISIFMELIIRELVRWSLTRSISWTVSAVIIMMFSLLICCLFYSVHYVTYFDFFY